jgi:hypothetical protein
MGHELVTGAVEAVFGAFGDADVENFRKSRAVGSVDQSPLAQGLDEAVGNHELGRGNGALARETLCITIIMNELNKLRALDRFSPKIHRSNK